MIEKLIRHHLPDQIRARGEKCETRIAEPGEMLGLLRNKLIEEVEELCEAIAAGGADERIDEELADVREVVEVLDGMRNFRSGQIMSTKRAKYGTFRHGVVLKLATPVPMVLHCPKCAGQHVDRGVWASTRVHRTHLCEHCGFTWKPFEHTTIGVEAL